MRRHLLYTGLMALAPLADSQSLPYNPSNIFLRPNSNIAYIFRPSSHSPNEAQLFSYDYSKGFITPESSFTTVSESLPFLSQDTSLAYTPTISGDGNMTVVAGDCSLGADGAQTWLFRPDEEKASASGTWSQIDAVSHNLGSEETMAGSNYLASAASFSQYANASDEDTKVYTFGGMCPDSSSTTDTWQKEADYSNLMLELSKGNSGAGSTNYAISALENRGPPIAQAGATLTGLRLAYSSRSSDGRQAQQQDFVLLGGHTQTAFINTSQVAVFSLPQASWSFMPVLQPSSAKTDLAMNKRQDVSEVTPRSGHTAVLSERGDSMIVFGGWVGNVNTPASPQLAILDMGSGPDWSWRIPSTSGGGLAADTGIYGHGAAVLPGNVMMVVGGYSNGGSSSKLFRRSTQTSDQILFYNITSGSWLDAYSPPVLHQSSSGPLSQTSAKVGLGTGLALGAALLVSVVVFYFWYSKRLRRSREERQRTLLAHSSDGSFGQMDQPFLNDSGFDGRGGDEAAVGRFWPTGGAAGSYPQAPEMQHTTGMFVNVPSPTRGLRKAPAGKNYQYHAAPRFDEKRISRGSGNIHPIAEQANEDEDEEPERRSASDELTDAERKLKDLERVLMTEDDPFADEQPNPLGSHPVSPVAPSSATVMRVPTGASRASDRTTIHRKPVPDEAEASNWTVERTPEEAIQDDDSTGRVSPAKSSSDERTSSTLSERSTRTTTSDTSITRTMSTRTGALLAAAAAAYRASSAQGNTSPTDERTRTMSTNGGRKSPYYFAARARSSTAGSATPGARNSMVGDADSFTTARSNFADLQSEGEALLGGRPTMDRDDPYQRAMAAQNPARSTTQPLSTSFGSMQQRRKPGLMGSLRRAINAVSAAGERSFSLTSSAEQYRYDPNDSSSSSPIRERNKQIGSIPRRAVSDGGALLKQKRGQKDWEDDKVFPPYHDDADWGEPRSSIEKKRAEDEWDVEGEASKRDVQVMFTVPKARLRVVNDDMDRASLRSASEGAVSRHNSVKELRSQESMKTLRVRSEGDTGLLPSTQEVAEEGEKEKAA